MKIGIVTWWRNNYGSILQAYALQNVLNDFENIECEIISQYDKNPANAKNFFKKLKYSGFSDTFKRVFWKFCFPKMRERTIAMNDFIIKNIKVSSKVYNERNICETNRIYDAFICGSDQIWNPTLTKLDSMYWLTFAENQKIKLSYAPSIGVKAVSPETAEKIRSNLSSFNGISCRELSGTNLLNEVLGNNSCVKVSDPTLLAEKRVWDDISGERKISEPYIFVYFLRCGKIQRKMVERFAREKKLKIVTMPILEPENADFSEFSFGDVKIWKASPSDFISYIRYADYVFTDSFHSSVFSIIYKRNFFIFPKKGKAQMERLISLLKENGISNRIIEKYEDIETIKDIDWEKTKKLIANNRKSSYDYLKRLF